MTKRYYYQTLDEMVEETVREENAQAVSLGALEHPCCLAVFYTSYYTLCQCFEIHEKPRGEGDDSLSHFVANWGKTQLPLRPNETHEVTTYIRKMSATEWTVVHRESGGRVCLLLRLLTKQQAERERDVLRAHPAIIFVENAHECPVPRGVL